MVLAIDRRALNNAESYPVQPFLFFGVGTSGSQKQNTLMYPHQVSSRGATLPSRVSLLSWKDDG
ncbi:uncharacterized protein PHALS_04280 [Plasmopara halstedii]|uniref:Uncharacterized protein n=1 Tax=Plasmopara halstedii TaxID=4781 RepID=A0A0P1B0D4_PLAHL|nr:uncharacterized protein PHALS_04280 [Plasmopara halstedii]CEG47404.1 hypothetical protein PHALS_04280 [Plasmopara halstedii]|eukprot:XP_024583773.1 hypothetical protein PHALS_04280 [Plasmopara halstedii]